MNKKHLDFRARKKKKLLIQVFFTTQQSLWLHPTMQRMKNLSHARKSLRSFHGLDFAELHIVELSRGTQPEAETHIEV